MIAAILAQVAPTLATKGNLNNDIGMPLTLMRLQDESYAVIEMGANHHGEIDYLSRICRPDVALLNNAGRAHREGFGDLAGVAKAKSEILHGLKKNGVFVYNADDRFADQWVEKASDVKRIGFGLSDKAHVRSQDDSYTIKWLEEGCVASFDVETEATSFSVSLKLLGKHNRMNALGAISVALSLDVPVEKVQAGLASLDSVPGRLHSLKGLSQSRLIDDSYNANPESVIAAIKLLSSAPGRRILVLGDLVELGDDRDQLHAELGEAAAAAGVDVLFTCGQHIQNAHDAFTGEKHHYQQQEDLIAAMQSFVAKDDVVLVKGSRSSRMENVVSALKREASIC
jgi:UDP-N-acetylmuramoyl-tripeptide--D-alanyl-D-alanine ligase